MEIIKIRQRGCQTFFNKQKTSYKNSNHILKDSFQKIK